MMDGFGWVGMANLLTISTSETENHTHPSWTQSEIQEMESENLFINFDDFDGWIDGERERKKERERERERERGERLRG